MKEIKNYIIFWLFLQFIIIFITNDFYHKNFKNIKKAQSISSFTNSIILILFFLYHKKNNIQIYQNILLFSAYYITDIIYYIVFFITDIDLISNPNNDIDIQKKNNKTKIFRIVYLCHHIIALLLLYSAYYHIEYIIIYKYTNLFIILLEIPTIFLNLSNILDLLKFYKLKKISQFINLVLFIICRTILYNFFLYKFIKKDYNIISKRKKINKRVLKLSITNLYILGFFNIIYGIKNLFSLITFFTS